MALELRLYRAFQDPALLSLNLSFFIFEVESPGLA